MGYNIQYKKSVYRDLKNLSKDDTARIIEKLETSLQENPLSNPELKGEFKGLRKLRIGDYLYCSKISRVGFENPSS